MSEIDPRRRLLDILGMALLGISATCTGASTETLAQQNVRLVAVQGDGEILPGPVPAPSRAAGQRRSVDEQVQLEELRVVRELSVTIPAYSMRPSNYESSITIHQGVTYFVYVNEDWHPMVGRKDGDAVTLARLDPRDDYRVLDDGHHRLSIGVSPDGYLHVAGDMHHYPDSATSHLPARYKGGTMMYWVSNAPADIGGFSWVGNRADRTPNGHGYTYITFKSDRNGDLYMHGRGKTHRAGHRPGELGLVLYKYNQSTRDWDSIGGIPHISGVGNPRYPVLAWEDNGSIGGWYQTYTAGVRFDRFNRMHVCWNTHNDQTPVQNTTHLLYAYSDDGGRTFHKADGSRINSLPLRADPVPGQADITYGPGSMYLWAFCFHDRDGVPAITAVDVDPRTGRIVPGPAWYQTWMPTASRWSERLTVPTGGSFYWPAAHQADAGGILTLFDSAATNHPGRGDSTVFRTRCLGCPGKLHKGISDGPIHGIDLKTQIETGVFRGWEVVCCGDVKARPFHLNLVRIEIANRADNREP